MRPSAGTPYLARVPEIQAEWPQASSRKAAIYVVASPSGISPLGRGSRKHLTSPSCKAVDDRLGLASRGVQPARRKAAVIARRSTRRTATKETAAQLGRHEATTKGGRQRPPSLKPATVVLKAGARNGPPKEVHT